MADEADPGDTTPRDPTPGDPTPGEAAAAQERSFWETRRRYHELDDDEAGRREKRRLSKVSRRMNLEVRMHRYARNHDEGPVPGDLRLPPPPPFPSLPSLPDSEAFPDENEQPGTGQ